MKSKLLLCMAILLAVALILIAAAPEKKNDPNDAARLNNLGCAYMNQQLFEKGLKYFEDAANWNKMLEFLDADEIRLQRLTQGAAVELLFSLEIPEDQRLADLRRADKGPRRLFRVCG